MKLKRRYNAFLRRHHINIYQLRRDVVACLLGVIAGFITFYGGHALWQQIKKPVVIKVKVRTETTEIKKVVTPTATPTVTPKPVKKSATSWTGKVSHYSKAGCLGCSATLTMANGETLDDNRLTIAFNHLPMNTRVRLTNLDNGKSIIATVTDTGGFEKYNRIADLVPAVATALETKTDVSKVLIETL